MLIVGIIVSGTIGYMLTADLDPLQAFYMTVITISTVGYGELGNGSPQSRIFTIFVIAAAIIWGAWAIQSILGAILSDEFRQAVAHLRTIRKVQNMENHIIICGFGRIGEAAVSELQRNKKPFVIIENDPQVIERLRDLGYHVIDGDATEDKALIEAGIKQAARLLATLNDDNANIVTVLSARELNPNIWIASRLVRQDAYHKLLRAGADEVVSPYDYGGRRLALTALRPHVAEFLTQVVFDEGRGAEMDELEVKNGSELAGQSLGEADLRQRFGITVIALYHQHIDDMHLSPTGHFELNPGPNARLHPGDVLILVGTGQQLQALHEALKL